MRACTRKVISIDPICVKSSSLLYVGMNDGDLKTPGYYGTALVSFGLKYFNSSLGRKCAQVD